MQEELGTIERLMRSYGHTCEANLAAIARSDFDRHPQSTCHGLNCAEWWQSTDSLVEIMVSQFHKWRESRI